MGYSPWGRTESDTTKRLNHHHHHKWLSQLRINSIAIPIYKWGNGSPERWHNLSKVTKQRLGGVQIPTQRVSTPNCMHHYTSCCPPRSKAPSKRGDICSCLDHLLLSQPRGKYFQNNCSGMLEDSVASSRWQTPSGAGNTVPNLDLMRLNLILWEGAVCWGTPELCLPSRGQRSRCWY